MNTGVRTFAGLALATARRSAWVAVALGALAVAAPAQTEVAMTTVHVGLSGSVHGLVPGKPAPLRVHVRNDSAAVAHVTRVTATAGAPGGCGRYLTVAPFAGMLDVPPNAVRDVVLRAHLDAALPAQCRTVAWRLDYTAR
jgi:hypothetical protein